MDSDRVSRARPYSGTCQGRLHAFAYGTVTPCGESFQTLRLTRNFVTSRPAGRRIKTGPTTPARQQLPLWHRTGLGSSPFARHYSGSRGFFPFLRLLRCFSSPACRCSPYGFRREHARITTRGFPHSEIPGSKVGQHLPRAYRSRPRPSSALGAKASTACSCSLDHEEHVGCHYGVFKVHAGRRPPWMRKPPSRRSLKTQQRT